MRQHAKTSGVEDLGGDSASRWRLQRELGMFGEKRLYLHVVLLGLERAGAVDEQTARSDDARCTMQDRPLGRCHHAHITGCQAPPRIGVTAKRTGSRAGGVNQDRIQRTKCGKAGVAHERYDFLRSDADLDALVKLIAESLPQPMLPFALGAS